MLGVAQRAPTDQKELRQARGVDDRHSKGRIADEILAAVRDGIDNEPPQAPRSSDDLDRTMRPAVTLVSAWVSQLARDERIASTAELVPATPGQLARQGAPPSEVLFLLEGVIRVKGGDPAPASVEAPTAINLVDVLKGHPLRHTLVADGRIVALRLGAPAFLTMLGDNIATAQGLFRMLIASPTALDWSTISGPSPTAPTSSSSSARLCGNLSPCAASPRPPSSPRPPGPTPTGSSSSSTSTRTRSPGTGTWAATS